MLNKNYREDVITHTAKSLTAAYTVTNTEIVTFMMRKQELLLRCSLAIDFLQNSIHNGELTPAHKDGEPVDHKKCSMELKIKTISLLLFYSEWSEKQNLADTALKMLDKVLDYQFDHHTGMACLIKDARSFTSWQAAIAPIMFKLDRNIEAVSFMESLRNSIRNTYVEGFFLPGTSNEIIKQSPKLESPLGILALAFLIAHKRFNDVGYGNMAHFIGDLIVKKGRFDALDIWTTRLLNDAYPDKKYKLYADHMLTRTNSISPISMSSLVAAISQQSNLAWIDTDSDNKEKVEELLTYQFSLQDMKTGAFHRTPSNDEIRLDYTVQNIISFLLYLHKMEDEEIDILKLLT